MDRLVFNFVALLLNVLFAISGFSNMMFASNLETPAASLEADSLRYLALGDSYTIGEGVTETERFPYRTVELLRAGQVAVADPQYIATTGWTTQDLLDAIANTTFSKPYDLITLLCGVNDQYQNKDSAGYSTRFSQLLDKAIALTGGSSDRVFVLSIPDYSTTPFVQAGDKKRVHEAINNFNAINKELTLSRNIAYIDITQLTRMAALDKTLMAPDELHYSGKEHQKWAELVAPVMLKSLQP